MTDAAPSLDSRPSWTPRRIALWTVLALLGLLWSGQHWLAGFRPKPLDYGDFAQEWLSARNWQAGRPVYSPQVESLFFHTGKSPLRTEDMLPWNAHPPASVLLALPLARLDYRTAHLAWNLVMLALFAASLTIVLRETGIPLHPAGLLPILTLSVVCYPLLVHFARGALEIVLLFLTVIAWRASRRERHFLGGSLVGIAAAIKFLPAFLLLFWLRRERPRGLLGGALAFALVNVAAWGVFGTAAYSTYFDKVIPSNLHYRSSWGNVSLPSLWMKLFDPGWPHDAVPLFHSPLVAVLLTLLSQAALALLTLSRCLTARTRDQRDWAMALALIGMVLASPIAWNTYFLLLLVPLAMLWRAPLGRGQRVLFDLALLVIWVNLQFFMFVPMGKEVTLAWVRPNHLLPPARPWQTLVSLSAPTYALLILFYLAWRYFPKSPSSPIGEISHPATLGCC